MKTNTHLQKADQHSGKKQGIINQLTNKINSSINLVYCYQQTPQDGTKLPSVFLLSNYRQVGNGSNYLWYGN